MSRTVSMPADALSQLLHFFNELLARHPFKISVHGTSPPRFPTYYWFMRERQFRHPASTVTSVVTELAIKHSLWAPSWSAAICSEVGGVVPPNTTRGRKMTRVM